MYLKSLAIFEKASISLKKASNIIEIFIKASQEVFISLGLSSKSLVIFIESSYSFKKAFTSLKMYFKSLVRNLYKSHRFLNKASTSLEASKPFKMSHNNEKNLHLPGNNFKKPRIL
jgi:hypothetical protein